MMTAKSIRNFILLAFTSFGIFGCVFDCTYAQTDVMGWGNITGIRVEGQKMEFGTSLRVVQSDWSSFVVTANEQGRPSFTRKGNTQTISVTIGSVDFNQVIEDVESGVSRITIQSRGRNLTNIAGAFFCIELPDKDYSGGSVELVKPINSSEVFSAVLKPIQENGKNEYLKATAKGIKLISPKRQLEIDFSSLTEIIVNDDRRKGDTDFLVYLKVLRSDTPANVTSEKVFTIKAAGEIDTQPVTLTIDPTRPGRKFDGIGGNFRLQNANADPPVIQYNLENLRVEWGRVQMPWSLWHPSENIKPIEAANSGQLNRTVRQAMKMAQILHKRGIPVVLSTWSAPRWAILGGGGFRQQRGGLRGNPIDPEKMDTICDSISDYVLYLKNVYGVEAAMYSFNESDLGINIRQTGEEHAELIKNLGAAFAAKGLATKMLLGDTSDASAIEFIQPALNDPETHKYIGAVSFHSWRGGSDELFARWGEAAGKLNVPFMVGEGSIDPAAHGYPAIFLEPSFALEEIDLYIRICRQCQPISILQWQLTSDYPIVTGGSGGRRTSAPKQLQPTQRFWNLKQLGSTEKGSFWLPISCDRPSISSAAFGDIANGKYAIHLVNNGTTRPVTLDGLPDNVKRLRIYVTDGQKSMKEAGLIPIVNGMVKFTLESASYTSLFAE